jgi:hypothetical protein
MLVGIAGSGALACAIAWATLARVRPAAT